MKKGLYSLWFSIVLLSAVSLKSQEERIHFDRITIKDGLSQSSVNCIFQDSQGFIWIGTQDGLNKFNGYSFEIFRNDPYDSTSLVDNYIRTIIQDDAGIMWIGTDNGLCIYNPSIDRFTSIGIAKNEIGNKSVFCLAESPGSLIWIGTEHNGLFVYNKKEKRFRHFTSKNTRELKSDQIRSLIIDSSGLLWIGTWNGGVTTFGKNGFSRPFPDVCKNTWTITEDDEGEIWIGTNNGLVIYNKNNNSLQNYYNNEYDRNTIGNNIVKAIFQDNKGVFWIGTDKGLDNPIIKNEGLIFRHYRHNDYLNTSLVNDLVQCIYEDLGGTIWIGTNSGLSKFDPAKQGFQHYQHIPNDEQSISDNNVWSILEDNNKLLVGTREGLDIIELTSNNYTHIGALSQSSVLQANPSVLSLFQDSKNRIWTGTSDGLFMTDQITKKMLADDFIQVNYNDRYFNHSIENRIYTIFEDNKHRIWVGTKNGLSCIYPDNTFRFLTHSDSILSSLSNNTVRAILQDKKGRLWVGTEKGLNMAIYTEDSLIGFKHYYYKYGKKNCLSNDMVLTICETEDGILWIGTYGGGLCRFDPDKESFNQYTQKDGLPNNVIYGVLADKNNNLWMSTNKGLCFYNIRGNVFKHYEEDDGLQSNEFNTGAFYKNKKGSMYFGGINGFNVFDPLAIQINPFPPKMVITDLKVYNKSMPLLNATGLQKEISSLKEITLLHEQDHFELEYAALHYLSPQRNQYKFKMVGFDENWIEAGTRRVASYTNLDPGDYVFLVKGCNSDGIWSEEVASLKIIIKPPYWSTWWFRLFALLLTSVCIYLWIMYRERNIRLQNEFLEEQVKLRTDEVMKQKEKIEHQRNALQAEMGKVDDLLLNILPKSTVHELKSKGRANARHYRKVSVMFADVQNFTKISESMRPAELVELLDRLFIKFDEIISQYNIEKIKTIGDAYMCAGGVPIRNRSNPFEITLAALKMQKYMASFNNASAKNNLPDWQIRIGVHSGPVTAGILGKKRFAYDIWGDTVNVANRMESAGQIGKVNISDKTYAIIKDFFVCKSRGKIEVKNKGEISMYFVKGIVPELSIDGKGEDPNELFWQYVNLNLYSSINYKKAEKYIIQLLRTKLNPKLYYHCLEHTLDVCKAVERIALAEKIVGEDLFLLKTAALFHDAGFIRQYNDHEKASAELCRELLPDYGYPPEKIDTVVQLILATQIPQSPKSHLEEIICDADLDYLGRNDFNKISNHLMQELSELGIINDEKQWDEIQIKFLKAHNFFTKTARQTRQEQKQLHLMNVIERYEKDTYGSV